MWLYALALEVHIGEINARDLRIPGLHGDSAGGVWQIAAYRASAPHHGGFVNPMLKVPTVNHLLEGQL